jgi:uncharacterized protein (DUF362 family)/Pyruvate/2-oxoacid:ferredoxin oxidoreductase delta subunit
MNSTVAVRKCRDYELQEITNLISEIYEVCHGPAVTGKKVLLKPNILIDSDPAKAIVTHPVVVEAMITFLQSRGAVVLVGDSPAVHLRVFKGEKSGIYQVCQKTGASWVDFAKRPAERTAGKSRIRIASVINEVDMIISMPKFKNHDLVYFTGAIKNTLGLVPGFSKAKQHALYRDRESFSSFLVDLNEAVLPHFFLMDGIIGMEGHGPGQGTPVRTEVLIGSSNPVALDIIASTIAGYKPMDIPTTSIALGRGLWLRDEKEINYDGPDLKTITLNSFKRIPVTGNTDINLKFLKNRIKFLRKLERRPVFNHKNCTGCLECTRICPESAINMHPVKPNYVVLNDNKCTRCFCCSEVCQSNAVNIRRKFFGM